MTAPDLRVRIARALEFLPDSARLLSHGRTWWSAAEVRGLIADLDDTVAGAGVPPGAMVGIYMRNRPALVAAFAWALGSGHPVLLMNPLNPDRSVEGDMAAHRPAAVIACEEDGRRRPIEAATADCGAAFVIVPDRPGTGPRLRAERTGGGGTVEPDVAIMMFTSGTTGPPKRVPLRRQHIQHALTSMDEHYLGRADGEVRPSGAVVILCLPPVNISGMWAVITMLARGERGVLLDRFEARPWAQAVHEHRSRSASLPPAALRMVLDADVPVAWLESLRAVWCGAAPLSLELADEFEARYGLPVLSSYGAAEFTGGITGWNLEDREKYSNSKRGSVGRPHPGVAVRVVDAESGEGGPPGEPGVIEVRSGQSAAADAQTWVRTNDLGWVDEDGFLYVDGRAGDVINRGGFKIQAAELERHLVAHKAVREAAVVGLPDDRLGEVPVAAVVLSTTGRAEPPDEDELISWVRDRVPAYMAPTRVRVTQELPRNEALKVIRSDVIALVSA